MEMPYCYFVKFSWVLSQCGRKPANYYGQYAVSLYLEAQVTSPEVSPRGYAYLTLANHASKVVFLSVTYSQYSFVNCLSSYSPCMS